MIPRICIILVFFICSHNTWASKPVPGAYKEIFARLACGTAHLTAQTQVYKHAPKHPVRQQLARVSAVDTPLFIPAPQTPPLRFKSADRLAFYLSGWACITNHNQEKFFYLVYFCAFAAGCVEDKEWVGLMSLDGQLLNTNDSDLAGVMVAKGLKQYVEQGVILQDPLE